MKMCDGTVKRCVQINILLYAFTFIFIYVNELNKGLFAYERQAETWKSGTSFFFSIWKRVTVAWPLMEWKRTEEKQEYSGTPMWSQTEIQRENNKEGKTDLVKAMTLSDPGKYSMSTMKVTSRGWWREACLASSVGYLGAETQGERAELNPRWGFSWARAKEIKRMSGPWFIYGHGLVRTFCCCWLLWLLISASTSLLELRN